MKLKLLGAALLAAAVAAPAYADINNGATTPGNGELFLSVWHTGADGVSGTADDTSYTLDLGITLNDFASAAATPVAVAPQPSYLFTADALMTSFLAGAADTGSITWNIVGFDSVSQDRLISTADASFTGSNLTYTQFRTVAGQGATYLANVNPALSGAADTANNGSATFVLADAGYAGNTGPVNAFGTNVGGSTDFNNTGSLGETLSFWMMSETVASGSTTTRVTNLNFGGYGWTLASNGNLSYGALAAPVPEAETWAMLLAGLGMVGMIARRRKVA